MVDPDNLPAPTLRNRVLVKLLLQSGIRASEVPTIQIGSNQDWESNDLGDIDRKLREIEVIDHKNDDSRVVYYQASLDDLLRLWIEAERPGVFYAEDSPYLFPTRNSTQIDQQRVNEIVKQTAENAGIQETYTKSADGRKLNSVSTHTLRHTFAMHAIKGRDDDGTGADTLFVQQQLGHADISTTIDKYVHEDNDAQREAIQQHGPTF
jgi:integrase/recombinase XerD